MTRPTIREMAAALAFAIYIGLVAWGFWRLSERSNACDQRGGVMVRTIDGAECIRRTPP